MTGGRLPAIGRYQLVREIARGKGSAVYLAFDPQQERQVALKVIQLPSKMPNVAEIVERFRREAAARCLADHPNVAAILDAGCVENSLYLATEFVEGVSLDRRVGRPLDPAAVIRIVAAVAAALDAGHAAGIVHRDVQPAHILLGRDGRIVLTDFGTVGLLDGPNQLTKRGDILGSPAYLAPEVVLGKGYSPASDQYALAAVAFELLTGQPPFRGPTTIAVAHAHVRETPPAASAVRRNLPTAVDAVLARGLAKEPRERFPSCGHLAQALAEALGAPMPQPHSAPPRHRQTSTKAAPGERKAPDSSDRTQRTAEDLMLRRGESQRASSLRAEAGGEESHLGEAYERALFHVQAQDWATARELLSNVYAERPDYRDVAEQRKTVAAGLAKRWEEQARIQESEERKASANRASAKPSPWAHVAAKGEAGGEQAAADGGDVSSRANLRRRVVDDESLEVPQLQELVTRYEAAVAAANERDWATAVYLLESIERSLPELVRANRRLLLGTLKPGTPLQKRAPKIYQIDDLLKRGRAYLSLPGEHAGVISYRKVLESAAQVTGDAADGSFSISVEGDRLVLRIEGAKDGGQAVSLPELEAELSQWPTAEVDRAALSAALASAPGQPLTIGTIKFAYRETQGPAAGLGVVIADDEMRAYVVPTDGSIQAELRPQDVRAVLASAGVVSGLQEEAIELFANQRPRVFPATVAVGRAPEAGSPWRVVVCVDTSGRSGGLPVRQGTALLRVEQEQLGVPGLTVTGREVAPEREPPPDLATYAGPGTRLADDGLTVVAAESGIVTFEGHRAKVEAPGAEERVQQPSEKPDEGRPKVVAGRPVFGPGKQWVEISALNAQVAKTRAAELLGTTPDELEAREIGGAYSRWRSSESSLRRAAKRYRVQPRSVAGHFEVHAEQDGLYLTVWPPEGSGRPVTVAQVQAELARWPAARVTEAQIAEIVGRASGEPARLGPPAWLAVQCGTGHLGVVLGEGEMSAGVVALGDLRRGILDEGTVRAALAQAGVGHGILSAEVARFCRLEERVGLFTLAVGTPPGEISDEPEYLFPRDERAAPNVRPGTILAWARSPGTTPGRTVTGKTVLAEIAERRPLSDFIGEGTALEARPGVPGDHAIVAAAEGRPCIVNGRVSVLKHAYVAEPVQGTVAFEGSVTLAATTSGSVVRARGDVTLESDAGEVVLEAGGAVRLKGVDGNGKARIQSGDSVIASWLRGCLVMARDTINISAQLAHSTIMSARRVIVRGEGIIKGGIVRATEEIVAQRIQASGDGKPTRIVLGRLRRSQNEASNARLVVHGEIEPGVRITIDGATLEVTNTIRRSVLRQRDGVIQIEPLAA